MTIQEFKVLAFEKKCDVVTFHGNYIARRAIGSNCKVFLYHAYGFFIEIFYLPEMEKIQLINAFDDVGGLYPYLETISLNDLTTAN